METSASDTTTCILIMLKKSMRDWRRWRRSLSKGNNSVELENYSYLTFLKRSNCESSFPLVFTRKNNLVRNLMSLRTNQFLTSTTASICGMEQTGTLNPRWDLEEEFSTEFSPPISDKNSVILRWKNTKKRLWRSFVNTPNSSKEWMTAQGISSS